MEPAFHLVLPTLLVIALGVPIDTALTFAPLSLLFDLDILINAHRRFHSLVILTAIVAVFLLILLLAAIDHFAP